MSKTENLPLHSTIKSNGLQIQRNNQQAMPLSPSNSTQHSPSYALNQARKTISMKMDLDLPKKVNDSSFGSEWDKITVSKAIEYAYP